MKFAAIDIGSNAVRLLFSNVTEEGNQFVFKKASLIRVPLRLGEDAFLRGKISEAKAKQLIKTLTAFRLLIEVTGVSGFRACATSAMREAVNGDELVKRIKKESRVRVEVISGKEEASIIYSTHIAEDLSKEMDYLYIDVGGGSTELTFISNGKIKASRSFNVGTIRMLHGRVEKKVWEQLKKWATDRAHPEKDMIAIGSGGNINKLYKLSGQKQGRPMSIEKLKEIAVKIDRLSMEERISIAGLNPDRADVIIPAAKIFLAVMKSAGIRKVMVPQIGLADGIVHQLFEAHSEAE